MRLYIQAGFLNLVQELARQQEQGTYMLCFPIFSPILDILNLSILSAKIKLRFNVLRFFLGTGFDNPDITMRI